MSSLLSPGQFAGDDGSSDPALVGALEKFASDATDLEPVVAAISRARLLVPVVAVLGDTTAGGPGPAAGESHGLGHDAGSQHAAHTEIVGDKNADMALVLLTSPGGQPALPAFTCQDSMRHWNPQARPVPVEARRAALSAVDEGCDLIVVDPAGPITAVLNRPAVWALAQGRRWVPSPRDPEVVNAVREAVGGVPHVQEVGCRPGHGAELAVVCTIEPGLDRAGVDAVTTAISESLASLAIVAERVASVELTLR